ncbi:MAG: FAD-dependent tricarballylate dehydrogenase TcuA [Lentilitoribacter sp.]
MTKNPNFIADIIVVGSGNSALCAAIAAIEKGANVLIIEKANEELAGGNSKYTAGAMRFVYNSNEDLMPLLKSPDDTRLSKTDFGSYTADKFRSDLLGFNDGRALSVEQNILIDHSNETMLWLAENGIKFEPIYERQSFEKDGRFVFWGGLTLAADGEGVGLVDAELEVFKNKGGRIRYNCSGVELITKNNTVIGIRVEDENGVQDELFAGAIILGSGGFEASSELRKKYIGSDWDKAKVRGTPHNTGQGLKMALELGASEYGFYEGCHATPMDLHMKNYGNLDIPHFERKNYRKICYFLGIMLNANGERFVDEGIDFRNYTYAQFGRAIIEQPGHFAWQIFDAKVDDLLYGEYTFHDAHFVKADTLDELIDKLDGIEDKNAARTTIDKFNNAVDKNTSFDPTIKDGKGTLGLELAKSNWAQTFDKPPYKAYPVTCGITFTYGGLKVNENGNVLTEKGEVIDGLFACGELVGGVFYNGYPGGSGLTSGAVFGRRAGYGAAKSI